MVLEMAVTQIRSTVQHRHWSPPNQLCISDAQLLSVPFSSLLLFSFSFFALTHGSNLGVLSWTERMCGWAQGSVSTLAPSPLLFNPLILKRTKMENKRQTLPIHLFSTSSNSASVYIFSWLGRSADANFRGHFSATVLSWQSWTLLLPVSTQNLTQVLTFMLVLKLNITLTHTDPYFNPN